MFLSRSFRRKLLATALTAVALVLLYDATVMDSRYNGGLDAAAAGTGKVAAGARLDFVATAYCRGQTTASGVDVQAGIAAADEGLLPEGHPDRRAVHALRALVEKKPGNGRVDRTVAEELQALVALARG